MVDFPRAPVVTIEWVGRWKPLYRYVRGANFAGVSLGPLHICWRRPWLPRAAYQMGWDAGWRAGMARSLSFALPKRAQKPPGEDRGH